MSAPNGDFGDLAALDDAYELPETITNPKLRRLYEVMVARMRDEAKHLPMNTIQQLLIERICYCYVVMRDREAGNQGGVGSVASQKDFHTLWLTMTAEFNRMLGKDNGTDRKALLQDIQKVIFETLATVPDTKMRSDLLHRMAANFQAAGI